MMHGQKKHQIITLYNFRIITL